MGGSGLIGSFKVLAVSVGVVWLAVGMKCCYPVSVNGIPMLRSMVLSWMKPPYLYLVINCIIVSIAASSRFQRSRPEPLVPSEPFVASEPLIPGTSSLPEELALLSTDPVSADLALLSADQGRTGSEESTAAIVPVYAFEDRRDVELAPVKAIASVSALEDEREVELTPATANGSKDAMQTVTPGVESGGVSADSKLLEYNTTSHDEISARYKPLVSSRFNHRKPIRSTPEGGKALRVARPKRLETVESTWKMITEGRHVPLTRHQKKLESETLKNKSSLDPPVHRIRKEPSPGQDELNRRVEAFINKFNEEMRLQRQESLKRYMEMMSRRS